MLDVMVHGAAVMSDTRPSLSVIAEGKRYLSDGTKLNELLLDYFVNQCVWFDRLWILVIVRCVICLLVYLQMTRCSLFVYRGCELIGGESRGE